MNDDNPSVKHFILQSTAGKSLRRKVLLGKFLRLSIIMNKQISFICENLNYRSLKMHIRIAN